MPAAYNAPADKLSLGQARALVKLYRLSTFLLKSALMNVATMRGKNHDKPCWCGVIVHNGKHDEFCRRANRAIKSTQHL